MSFHKVNDKYVYPYPSHFGSHASMVVPEETAKLGDPALCVCKDDDGLYVTEKKRLDNGMADPLRHAEPEWRRRHLAEVCGQVIEIVEIPGAL